MAPNLQYNKSSSEKQEYCFCDVCRSLKINPYKSRFWQSEAAKILGITLDAFRKARRDNKNPYGLFLFRWNGNGRVFVQRQNLVDVFNNIIPIT